MFQEKGGDAMRVFNIVMRVFNTLLWALLVLLGLVWICQGFHIGPAFIMQGFMVNDRSWAVRGAILIVVAIAQLVWANTRQSKA